MLNETKILGVTIAQILIGLSSVSIGCNAGPDNETISSPLESIVNFNNDGLPDLLWHNGSSGQSQAWSISGTSRVGLIMFDAALDVADSSGWLPVGITVLGSDVDVRRNIIWHNGTSGQTLLWFMDNTGHRNSVFTLSSGLNVLDSSGWRFVATGRFNGDTIPDYVWHNGTTGETQIWFMDSNLNRSGVVQLDASLNVADSTGWRIVGADDMNGDGPADLVWHNGTSGETRFWYMNGGVRLADVGLDASLNVTDATGWRIVGINDFNSDGRPDIIWHNGTGGQTQIWNMLGLSRIGATQLDASLNVTDSSGWKIVRD